MRILHVIPTNNPNYGGPVKVAEAISEIARQKNFEAALYPDKYISENGRSFLYYPGMQELIKLKNLLKHFDIIHNHGLWSIPTSFAALLARFKGFSYVVTPHGMLDRWSLKQSRTKKKIYASLIERKNLNNASAIHFLNEQELLEAKEFGITAPTFVLPNGADLDEYKELPGHQVMDEKYPELKNKIVLLFLGRIHAKKGFDLLIPAFKKAIGKVPELHLVIAGPDEGGYKKSVHDMILEYSLSKSVTFTGFVESEDKNILLAGSDIFILTSHQEGDSIAIKEALASGLPVIITKQCNFPDVCLEEAGIVVDTDIDEITKALIDLAQDKSFRIKMSDNAISLIKGKYSWDYIGSQMIEVYQDILENRYTSECWRL